MTQPKPAARRMVLLLDLLAMLAVACVCLPFASLPVAYFPHTNIWGRTAAILLCFAAGWGIQHLICLLTRHRRAIQRGGYEKSQKYYFIGLAIPVWLLALSLFFFLPDLVDAHLMRIAEIDSTYYYDRFSVFPIVVPSIAAALLVLGGAVRLYPYSRAISLRACMTYITLLLISFFIGGGNISAAALFIFSICAAIVMNQSALDREQMSLSLTEVSMSTRLGGLRVVIWLGAALVALSTVMAIIVGGGMMVGRILLFMLFRQREEAEREGLGEYASSEEIIGSLNRYLVREGESGVLITLLMVLFVVGLLLLVLWFAIRRNETIRLWLQAIMQRISDFLDWIFGASTRLYYRPSHAEEEISYRDAYKKLRPTGYDAVKRAGEGKMSWREFRTQLAACPDDNARMAYAYPILAALLRAQPIFPLLRSDTPRSIDRKVRSRGRHEELQQITSVYEAISYAERPPKSDEVSRALEMTCRILKGYFD